MCCTKTLGEHKTKMAVGTGIVFLLPLALQKREVLYYIKFWCSINQVTIFRFKKVMSCYCKSTALADTLNHCIEY